MKPPGGVTPARVALVLGHLLFLGLVVLALQHARLRMINVDSAFQFFKWVQQGAVEAEAHRFAAIVPQLLVKVGRWLGLGLNGLLLLASVAHVLVPWAVYTLLAHAWRLTWLALATALAAVLCTRLSFYGPVLEVHYLLCYPLLLAGALLGPLLRRRDRNTLLVAVLCLFAVLLAHPLGAPVALYVLALVFLLEARLRGPVVLLAVLALLWWLIARWLLPPTGYEQDLYTGISFAGEHLRASAAMDMLLRHSWADTALYLPLWGVWAATVVLWVLRRKWAIASLAVAGPALFLLITVATYHAGETALMMEKNFLPMALLTALPLLALLRGRVPRWPQVALFALLLFSGFRTLSFGSRPVAERYRAIAALVEEVRAAGHRKAVVPDALLNERTIGVAWALPFETLLISSLEGTDRSLTAVPQASVAGSPGEGVALPPWYDDLPAPALHPRYFKLPVGPYVYFATVAPP